MKSRRHESIIRLISDHDIQTQQQLKDMLEEKGISVTQATLSRDINEIGLIKKNDRYTLPENNSSDIPQLLRDSVVSVDFGLNTVVFRCHPGMAGAACAVFDRLERTDVVGTVAGDDTIFAVMRSEKDAAAFVREMKNILFYEKR